MHGKWNEVSGINERHIHSMLSRYRDRDRDFPGFTDPDQSRDPEIYRDRD